MQAKKILERTGCPEPAFKDWLSKGIVLPAEPGEGKGTHAVYDESNAAAILMALRMKDAGIVVRNYVNAFRELHAWLRETSSFDWHRYLIALTPAGIEVYPTKKTADFVDASFVIPMTSICQALAETVEDKRQYQMFRVHAVRKAR